MQYVSYTGQIRSYSNGSFLLLFVPRNLGAHAERTAPEHRRSSDHINKAPRTTITSGLIANNAEPRPSRQQVSHDHKNKRVSITSRDDESYYNV